MAHPTAPHLGRPLRTNVFYDAEYGIWSSPNSTAVNHPIAPYDMEVPFNSRFRDFGRRRWLSNSYPYLAFWPIDVSFSGPLFLRLNINDLNLQIVSVPSKTTLHYGCYMLHPDTIASWERLESALLDLTLFLFRRQLKSAEEIGFLPLPRDCGYKSTHREEKFVRLCAYKSRDAFVALATACSFAIALNMTLADSSSFQPAWVAACRVKGVNEQWLNDLQNSFVCNFSPGFRCGAYVNAYESTWAKVFPAFALAGVPLLIWWGHNPGRFADDTIMPCYLPNKDEVSIAQSRASGPLPGRSSVTHHPFSTQFQVPEPHGGSRQDKGEMLEQFAARMAREHQEYLDVESEEDKHLRLEREAEAEWQKNSSTMEEPTVGTAIYRWVKYPGGYQIRTLVPRVEWKAFWPKFSPFSRRYYSMTDEWDLDVNSTEGQEGLELDDYSSATILDMNDTTIFGQREASHRLMPTAAQTSSLVSNVIKPKHIEDLAAHDEPADYDLDVHETYGSHVRETHVDTMPLLDVLHKRYGYLVQTGYSTPDRMTRGTPSTDNNKIVLQVMARVGLKHYLGNDGSLDQAVVDMYNFYIGYDPLPKAFPPLWDSGPQLSASIMKHSYFHYYRVERELHLIGVRDSAPLFRQWYLLAIFDATAVLQIFREHQPSLGAMIRSLITRGIPFATVKAVKRRPSEIEERRNIGLGRRGSNHAFGVSEYIAYEDAKNNVLTGSFGRVALMRGGIVWRLAQGVVQVKAVTKGPSSSSMTRGALIGKDKEAFFVDDQMAEADEDIICGVYHVPLGMPS
jgi:hypothetical protein